VARRRSWHYFVSLWQEQISIDIGSDMPRRKTRETGVWLAGSFA